VITIFAPAGIGEVDERTDLTLLVLDAVAADPAGPLLPGDIVVVTSKIVSKAEGRRRPAAERTVAITEQTTETIAWRGEMRIVRTPLGVVQAAAGVDASNVDPGDILLLPADPDASAERIQAGLSAAVGGPVGVVVSDTAGRAWRVGQTDHAIGAAGVVVARSYAGTTDSYGNPLQVTVTALADELAAAADLVKGKLSQCPVAVIRGVVDSLARADQTGAEAGASALVRPAAEDMFARGRREAVVDAVLSALGRSSAYEDVVGLEGAELAAAVLEHCGPAEREILAPVLRAAGIA
jgi:coenzyme F420-0:L-glutamate ligase/coenzyme F420-1:gamma-L-glutamate ligase